MIIKKDYNKIIFLGSGGGKYMMSTQTRKTGGIYFEFDSLKFVLDPGPGSIVNAVSAKLEPQKMNGVLLSHLHPDHSTDVNVYLDAMIIEANLTPEDQDIDKISKDKKPFLITEESCVKLSEKYYPCVSKFHQNVSNVACLKDGQTVKKGSLKVTAVKADHYAPSIGFVIEGSRKIGYASDGTYYTGQEKSFEGCDLLILNVLVPKGIKSTKSWHMCVDEAIDLINKLKQKPKLVILHHLSLWMIRSNLFKQCKIITDATKVKTITAEDFLEINIDNLNERHILKPVVR